jgi:DNA repair protein RadA/Sms
MSVPATRVETMATKTSRASKAPAYKCAECGWTTVKWVGRCGECQAWGTVEETGTAVARTTAATTVIEPARRIAEVDATTAAFLPTGVDELDRVLGGGLVPGAVILLAGEPGVGKSTLLLDVAAKFARTAQDVLYVTGEESAAQVKLRAERIDAVAESLYLSAETDLGQALGQVEKIEPRLLIVDSVQTLSSADVDGSAGGVSQVREVAASIIAAAKRRNMTTLLVGHVTKDGSIAGPRLLEHLVDVVCQFEGERHSRLRMLRAVKNRYGPTDDVGCFDLNENGIEGLADPSGLFVSRTKDPVSGTCITVTMEGRRPLLAEVQSLLAESANSQPRRATSGLDSSRVSMLLAVLQQRAGTLLHKDDSYVATVGGVEAQRTRHGPRRCPCSGLGEGTQAPAHPADRLRRGGTGRRGPPGPWHQPAHPGGSPPRIHPCRGTREPRRAGAHSGRLLGPRSGAPDRGAESADWLGANVGHC